MRYHCDILTHGPGLVLVAGRFRIEGSSAPDEVVDGVSNVVQTTVARTGAGDFLVTLPKVGGGWPQEMISCVVGSAVVDATDAAVDELNIPAYVVGSYSKTAGTFQILNSVADDTSGAVIARAVGDPNDESEIHFLAILRNPGILAQTF